MIWHIARRELLSRLQSPMSWVVAGTWLAVQGLMFTLILGLYLKASREGGEWEEESVPTMGLLAGEQRSGTLPLLLSSPTSTLEVVLGKWLALVVYAGALVLLGGALAPATLLLFGDPPLLAMLGAAAGLLLLTGTLGALGLLASSLSGSQLVAAVLTWTSTMGLWLVAVLEHGDGPAAALARHGSLLIHVRSFGRGLVDGADVVWLLAVTAVALVAAWQRLESWRWR